MEEVKEKVEEVREKTNEKISETKATSSKVMKAVERKAKDTTEEYKHIVPDAIAQAKTTGEAIKEKVEDGAQGVKEAASHAVEKIKQESTVDLHGVTELARKAEDALLGLSSSTTEEPKTIDEVVVEIEVPTTPTYTERLPIGFEAPPGFALPSKPKSAAAVPPPPTELEAPVAPPPLPLVAPKVAEFSSSEPILTQLASTIDNLASFLKDNPSAATHSNAKEVIDTAEIDLVKLGERLQEIKAEEKQQLEAKLDEQAREYSLQLLRLEMEAQDRLDQQSEDWKRFTDMEREQIIREYRAKLEAELQAQSEIINQRYIL